MGAYKTTVPNSTEKSLGSAVTDPQSLVDTGLSTSDTAKLAAMFPGSPYLSDYDDAGVVATANSVLHPKIQSGKVGWAPAKVHIDYADKNAPDQTDLGTDEVPKHGYAPYPSPDDKSVQPSEPSGFDPQQPSDGLKKPTIEGPKLYKTIGEALGQGVKAH